MAITVKAELAGMVQSVEVEAGATVGPEDEVVVLSAMKMEIPVLASRAGRIAEILVAEGDVVNAGAVLFTVEG